MGLQIKIGLVKIPIMLINTFNSRYTKTGLHKFSKCCKSKVNMVNTCSNCGKKLTAERISKGLDSETILSDSQQEQLKKLLENGYLEVLSFKNIEKDTEKKLLTMVTKSQVVKASITKGFKNTDIKTFFSFKKALEENKQYAICKLIQRGTENLCILLSINDELMLFHTQFNSYNNQYDIKRINESINHIVEDENLNTEEFKEQAISFIQGFKGKTDLEKVKEQKAEYIEQVLSDIRNGKTETESETENSEENPFLKC